MSYKLLKLFIVSSAFSIILTSCSKNSQDNSAKPKTETISKKSAVYPDSLNKISFAGFKWSVIDKTELESLDDINLYKKECVFVDTLGNLHLNLKKIGDAWYGAELICDSIMDYGDFGFTLASPINNLDTNVVLFMSAVNAKQYVIKGLTETGIRFVYNNDPEIKSNVENYMYSTTRKFAGVKRSYVTGSEFQNPTSYLIGINPESYYYKVFKGAAIDESKILNSNRLTAKNKLTANSEIDELVYAKPYYKLKAKIGLAFYDFAEKYPAKDIEIIISKFSYFPFQILDIAKK